jgi:hypothetical protein
MWRALSGVPSYGILMKKWIFFFLFFIFLMAASFAGYLFMYRAEFLALGLSRTLLVPVKIKTIDFSKRGLTLRGFAVGNPPPCTLRHALACDKIDIKLNWIDFMKGLIGLSKKGIVIEQIRLPDVKCSFEIFSVSGSDNNFSRMLAFLSSPKSSSSTKFEIEKLTLTNVSIEIKHHVFLDTSLKPTPIPKIEFHNIGTNGTSTQDVIAIIIKTLIHEISKDLNLIETAPEKALKIPGKELKKAQDTIKSLFEKKE